MKEQLKRGHGNWVAGEGFWDREKELESIREYLEEGANLLLSAQRRIGKTSLLMELQRRLEEKCICIYIDLESCETASDAVVAISIAMKPYDKLWGKVKKVFHGIFSVIQENVDEFDVGELKIKLRGGVDQGNWKIKGDSLFATLAESEKPVILLLDEVPILVNRILKDEDYHLSRERIREAELFLSWLRDNGLKHTGKVQMILTGSIGLEPVLRQAGLSATINHLQAFHLKPWDAETTIGCLQALGKQYQVQFEANACERIVERLGCCIPHHVQMYFDYIYEDCKKRGDMTCTPEQAEEVYTKHMLSTQGHVELSHYEERLRMVAGKEVLPFALDVLTETAITGFLPPSVLRAYGEYYKDSLNQGDGERTAQEVIDVLEHDGYLKKGRDGYEFVSKLLRDWWKAHHEQMFTTWKDRVK